VFRNSKGYGKYNFLEESVIFETPKAFWKGFFGESILFETPNIPIPR
jgi:hypothetical protein